MSIKTLVAALASSLALTQAPVATAGSLVDIEVLARPGYRAAAIPSYWHQGQNYVEGRQNQEFRVRLRNKTAERVMAVLSVDGINAISGATAGLNQTGYVLAPYQVLDVDGWRKSNAQTAAFYFTHIADSYGARTGRPDNVGVIGAAIFREQQVQYYAPYQESERYSRAQPYADKSTGAQAPRGRASDSAPGAAPGAATGATAPSESKSYGLADGGGAPIGTGHGRREYRPSVNVEFNREDNVYELLSIRYDSRENLIAQGVVPPNGYYRRGTPEAFPQGGFTPDPDYSMALPYRSRRGW
jgi:hypothetical protein